jgi:hypothetical protein
VLSVSSLGVTLLRIMMSCWYQFLEVVRYTPLCWPAPLVILNPDLRTTVLVTNTATDGRCCVTTGVRCSDCSVLICSYRTRPSKSGVSATCRQAPQSDLPAPSVAEKIAHPAAAACQEQFSDWIEIRNIPPILSMANVEMCSNYAFPVSLSWHIDHAAEAWQSAATLLDYLSLPDYTTAALKQNFTFKFDLPRVLRLCTFHSPKHIDRVHASFIGQQT